MSETHESQSQLDAYLVALRLILTNAAHSGLSPQLLVERLAIEYTPRQPAPLITDIEWNSRTPPQRRKV